MIQYNCRGEDREVLWLVGDKRDHQPPTRSGDLFVGGRLGAGFSDRDLFPSHQFFTFSHHSFSFSFEINQYTTRRLFLLFLFFVFLLRD